MSSGSPIPGIQTDTLARPATRAQVTGVAARLTKNPTGEVVYAAKRSAWRDYRNEPCATSVRKSAATSSGTQECVNQVENESRGEETLSRGREPRSSL